MAGVAIFLFRHYTDEKDFITILFLAALVARLGFGMFLHLYDLRSFFGGDSLTFDYHGQAIVDYWMGLIDPRDYAYQRATISQPGWGMNYLVGTIYLLAGKNILAAQSFCATIGAATAPMVYFCANKIFNSRNVAKTANDTAKKNVAASRRTRAVRYARSHRRGTRLPAKFTHNPSTDMSGESEGRSLATNRR